MEYFWTTYYFDKMHEQIPMKSKYFREVCTMYPWTRNVVESWYFDIYPENIMTNRLLGIFPWNNFKRSIILTKWEIISKSQWNQKYFSKSHLSFVYEPGMWWNVVDYLYLWKTHFLNFRDFQESPNPPKYRFPPLHPISAPDTPEGSQFRSRKITGKS